MERNRKPAILRALMEVQINPEALHLPVATLLPALKKAMADGADVVVQAPPGAGKSTLLPLALLGEPWLEGKKILLLEPRRLAARGIAHRMAEMIGEACGETVGYRIRFENRISDRTQLEVITEGILTRMLQSDNALEGVGMVIFDEFHERSLHADLALALCREAQQVLRPDLRLLLMSATMDADRLGSMLKAQVLRSEGRMFPVEHRYVGGQDVRLISETTARVVLQAMREEDGDVLVFLPGEAEIMRCADMLKAEVNNTSIHPLFGMMPIQEQVKALLPSRDGRRKIVLATSIAETSLTIEGIKIVVDSGLTRIQRFDPNAALSRLETVQVSMDAADQRAGRAGRLGPSVCYRMWTAATQHRLQQHRTPEILEADLSALALELLVWGATQPEQLLWMDAPPAASYGQAITLLEDLGAIENGKITAHGQSMHKLGCHPRLAHMLLMAQENHNVALACDVAALLEERDPLGKEAGIDLSLRVEALRKQRHHKHGSQKYRKISQAADYYRNLLKAEEDNGPVDADAVGLLVAYAYPERIASARPGNNAQFQMANGKLAMAGHQDALAHESWLAIAHLDARDGMGKIFMAAPLNPRDLLPMVKERDRITWDSRKGLVVASRDLRVGSIVLKSTPLAKPDPDKIMEVVLQAIRAEGKTLLNLDERFEQLQNRIMSVRTWNNDTTWPDVNTTLLLQTPERWLQPFLDGVSTEDALEQLDASDALKSMLSWEQQQLLEELAPEKINVPSGSQIRIQYGATGEAPVLSVRLQEVFGLKETPVINAGKTPLLMHLLSPGFKPVQVTADLRSFWNNTYHEVRRELQRRYPKHSWPEDPWNAVPVAKGGIRR